MGCKQKVDTIIGKAGIAWPQWDKIASSSNIFLEGERKEQGTEIRWYFCTPESIP